jgi:DNA-binding NarL/FixJ family response regulator
MLTLRQIKVLTVDDHPLLRQGIAAVIQGEKDMLIVGGCQWPGGHRNVR